MGVIFMCIVYPTDLNLAILAGLNTQIHVQYDISINVWLRPEINNKIWLVAL